MDAYVMVERMCDLAEEMTEKIDYIGISCSDPPDSKRGVIQIVSYLERRGLLKASAPETALRRLDRCW